MEVMWTVPGFNVANLQALHGLLHCINRDHLAVLPNDPNCGPGRLMWAGVEGSAAVNEAGAVVLRATLISAPMRLQTYFDDLRLAIQVYEQADFNAVIPADARIVE